MSTAVNKPLGADISSELIDAIEAFPTEREFVHCGQTIRVSPFDFYADCPSCGMRVKLRVISGVAEIEDVFDAVFTWMNRAGASRIAAERQKTLAAED